MSNNTEERLKKAFGDGRQDRAMEDRPVTERRDLSDDDRIEAFRQSMFQSALPNLPHIPGYRTCWLTTANTSDPIHRRISWGYEPIKASDIPGWEFASIKTGDWQGFIGVNEMLAFKIPEELWKQYMRENHHDAPNREGEKVTLAIDQMKENARRMGARLVETSGLSDVREKRSEPLF